jgi:asparagine synthase (glutamine-hydrolysing)
VSELARRHVTVAVGGEGADELFGGYPRYRWLARALQLERVLPARAAALAGQLLSHPAWGPRGSRLADVVAPQTTLERNLDWVTAVRRHQRAALYGPALSAWADSDGVLDELAPFLGVTGRDVDPGSVMQLDQRHWLPDDVLYKADRAGMLNSLEIRTPFLSRELAEFANGVPVASHLADDGKALLRGALAQYVDQPRRRWRKTAFRVPGAAWLRGPLRPLLVDLSTSGTLVSEGLVDRGYLHAVVSEHLGGADRTQVLWPLLAFGLWLDRWAGRQ